MIKEILKSVLPPSARSTLKRAIWRRLQKSLESSGYTVSRKEDYYSPLPSVSDLRAKYDRWYRPSSLKGVAYDIEEMKTRLSKLLSSYLDEFSALPPFEQLQKAGYGPGFTAVDALTLYMMIREMKPTQYIEVGSGLSTYYCSLAAEKNISEGYPLVITCIEPHPYEKLYSIRGIQVIDKEVQDVDLSLFLGLAENDVFFVDSSHILKIDGDVPFIYLEILPLLNPGVAVHIHDVPFPYNIPYPPQEWIFNQVWPMLWNEAMVLQAFLCFNNKFRIEMSTPIIRYFDEPFLRKSLPLYESVDENPRTFCSMWIKRVAY